MTLTADDKEIRWVGSSYDDLLAFPKAPRKEAGFQLGKVQAGLEPTDWKPFDEVGTVPGRSGRCSKSMNSGPAWTNQRMRWLVQQIGAHVRSSPAAQRAAKVNGIGIGIGIGIGEIGASALTAGVADFKQFKSGHQFGAWLGIVPSQNSSGGKASLGRLRRITKRGDDYLRTLLIQGAKSAVMSAGKRDDPTSKWLVQLTARVGWQISTEPLSLAAQEFCLDLRPLPGPAGGAPG